MKYNILIYQKYPLITSNLSIIISTIRPSSIITISENISDIFNPLISSKFDLIFVGIASENNDFFELVNISLPYQNNKFCIIFYTEHSNSLLQERCKSINSFFFILEKNCNENIIYEKINDFFLHFEIVKLISNITKKRNEKKELPVLSSRELECAVLLMNGYTNTEIANKLSLSTTTVSTYKKRVLFKTNTRNMVELTIFFRKKNIYSSVFFNNKIFKQ